RNHILKMINHSINYRIRAKCQRQRRREIITGYDDCRRGRLLVIVGCHDREYDDHSACDTEYGFQAVFPIHERPHATRVGLNALKRSRLESAIKITQLWAVSLY